MSAPTTTIPRIKIPCRRCRSPSAKCCAKAMASDEEGFSKHWKRIIEGWAAIGKPLSPQCVSLIMDVVDLATQTASSVRKTFTSQLDLWLNPLLDLATAASDFDLRDLRKKKMAVYLGSSRVTSSVCKW
jgi:type IV secretory pathway TraG/TraD family ATPase VirD4